MLAAQSGGVSYSPFAKHPTAPPINCYVWEHLSRNLTELRDPVQFHLELSRAEI